MAYQVKFDTGETVSFQDQPSDADIDEVVKSLGIKPKTATIPETSTQPKKIGIGQKILNAGTAVTNFLGGKNVAETFGAEIAKLGATPQEKQFITQPSLKETAGSALQLGANFIPGAGVGANLATKVAIGAGTGYAFDVGSKMQKDKSLKETLTPGIGTALGGGLPIAGAIIKPTAKIVGRLFKGLGSGLSGVSSESLDQIASNPKVAQEVSDIIKKTGNERVLESNARTIVNGVSKVRQEARKAFGEGLEQLSKTDINPIKFRDKVQSSLDSIGSIVKNGTRELTEAEFTDPKNIEKAKSLIDKLDSVNLDGKSLRKLADDIENATYKIATSDERLSFNAFADKLSNTIKDAISASTDKLDDINKAFSKDMQLVETVQNIFGKVNFKNLPEVVKASQKLEGIFAQKGLAPEVVDTFLERIGVKSSDFRTTESVRQILNKTTGANTKGLSIGEIVQQATSAVVTPEMVKNIAVATGIAKEKVVPFLNALKPSARNIVINALLQENQ